MPLIPFEAADRENYDTTQRILEGLENWLKFREADYSVSNTYGSQCQQKAIRGLIEEVQLCGENGELPWEVMTEKDPDEQQHNFDAQGVSGYEF